MKNVSIMAFDFGLKRIGVAIAHTETGTTHPLGVIEGKSNQQKMAAIGKLAREWRPDLLVVGLPKKADGGPHELWPDLLRFAARLQELGETGERPIYFVDESFSSFEAQDKLRDVEILGRKAKPYLDTVAAQSILEGLLIDAMALPYKKGMEIEDLLEAPVPLRALGTDGSQA